MQTRLLKDGANMKKTSLEEVVSIVSSHRLKR